MQRAFHPCADAGVLAWLHQNGLWLAKHLQGKLSKDGWFVHAHGSAALDNDALLQRSVAGAGVIAALAAPIAPRIVVGLKEEKPKKITENHVAM